MQQNLAPPRSLMAIEIDGIRYHTLSDVQEELSVSRQTLWRWRSDGRIPAGCKYRDGKVLFTAEEVGEILEYANRLEPLNPAEDVSQLRLFGGGAS